MRIGLLGAVTAWPGDADERPAALGGVLLRGLLARLALDVGRPVPVDTLVDDLWGSAAPDGVGNALQSLVSRLRRAVGAELIRTEPAGYRLALDADAVDAARFDALTASARAAERADPVRARALLAEAAALWRGPVLADVTGLPFASAAAHRLTDARNAAVEQAARLALAAGEPHAELAALRAVLDAAPLREPTAALLARALHAAGRQADALAVLDRTRTTLGEQLGVDPGAELAAAQLDVLRGNERDAAGRPATRRPDSPALSSFIGRDADVRRVRDALRSGRLVTLTGPGGAGKTRLARESVTGACAVRVVELAPLAAPAELPATVLAAVGGPEMLIRGQEAAEADTTVRLLAAVVASPMLLVLDNCEHLVADVAALVERLLLHAPTLRVLATSREPLGIAGELLHPVDALAPADAARLFVERARAVRPDFAPATATAEVAEICRRLDGLPLAIELAAARLRTLSPAEIATRLDDRFRLLTGGARTAPDRHQTLRAVVAWSWDLLDEPERELARRLAVFAGGATLPAVERVCAAPPQASGPAPAEVLEVLAALVDKSLVQAVAPADASGATRYRMLETIKAFAAERLDAAGERAAAAAAYAGYFAELAQAADRHLRDAGQLGWMARLRAESDNLLGALRHATTEGDAATALRLTEGLGWFWLVRGLLGEATGWLASACALSGEAPATARALSLGYLAATDVHRGDLTAAREHVTRRRRADRAAAGP